MNFKNHEQILKVFDRNGKELESVTVEGWDEEASWEVDMETTDNDLYRETDGDGMFEWEQNKQVLSALSSLKECAVYWQPDAEDSERIYLGMYQHFFDCEMDN